MDILNNETMQEEVADVTSQMSDLPPGGVAQGSGAMPTQPRSGWSWEVVRQWFLAHTFTPAFLTGKWFQPVFGYLLAFLLQVVAVTAIALLIHVFPSFRFAGALVILVVLFVALKWGVGPSVIATLVGAALLMFLLLSSSFSLALVRTEDVIGVFFYLGVGLAISVLASRAERARRSAEELGIRLDTIIEAIPDPLSIYDAQGVIIRRNLASRRVIGGRDCSVRTVADDSHALDLRTVSGEPFPVGDLPVTRVLRGEPIVAADMLYRDEEGHDHYVAMNATPLRNALANVDGAVVVTHDATEARQLLLEQRRYAETEARRALLQLILDELPSSVYLVRGRDARLVLANRAATAVWGGSWPRDKPMSEFLQENGIQIFSLDGRPPAPEQLATLRAVQYGETVRQQQEVIRHRDGMALPVLVNAVALDIHELNVSLSDPTEGPAEELVPAALVVHQDVSAIKEAERLKDEFIGIVAHELRNPLAILKGFAQTLIVQTARGKGPALADWQMEALQGIDSVLLHLDGLTEDLLDVTRLQAGRLELDIEPTDLVALVQRVVTRMQKTTEQHTLTLFLSFDHLVMHVDPRRIEQVLSNIISNAIKYSPEGGSIEVTIREDVEMHGVLLSVRDHGIGIPAQQQASVFGRFARANNAQAYGISGTGLGLYLSRELVERHGGRIWFESAEGQGSTFFVALPLAFVGVRPSN